MIPLLDYDHTFTVEVVLDGTIVSSTRHNLGDVSLADESVALTIDGSSDVSLSVPVLSPTPTG